MIGSWVRPAAIVLGALVALGVIAALRHSASTTQSSPQTKANARFVCDMHCEPGKVYDHAATCPVCRMALRTWEDVGFSIALDSAPVGTRPADTIGVRVLDPSGSDTTDVRIARLSAVAGDLSSIQSLIRTPGSDQTSVSKAGRAEFQQPEAAVSRIFAELLDQHDKPMGTPSASFAKPGASPAPITLTEDYDVVQHDRGYELRVRCNGKKFFAGEPSFIRLGVTRKGETVTNIEPLDSKHLAELVVVGVEPPFFARLSPILSSEGVPLCELSSDILESARSTAGLNGSHHDQVFMTRFPAPGKYRAFARVQHDGKPIQAAFLIDALPLDSEPDAPPATGHEHHTRN
jgi:hypothetical protein